MGSSETAKKLTFFFLAAPAGEGSEEQQRQALYIFHRRRATKEQSAEGGKYLIPHSSHEMEWEKSDRLAPSFFEQHSI